MRPEPVRHTRWEVHQRSGLDFAEFILDFHDPAAFESHIAVGCAIGVGLGASVHVIWGSATLVIVHLSRLYGVGRREPAAITKPDAGFGAEPADSSADRVTQRTEGIPGEEIFRSFRHHGFNRDRR